MEICFHRNIKSVIIIINFDAVILSCFFCCFFFRVSYCLSLKLLLIFFFPPHHRELSPGSARNSPVQAWLIAACSRWLNCNRFLENVRKRWGPVPFNVRQMRPEGKGLCYHSYVTECGEWQDGARSLIGVNICGAERRLSLPGNAQSMRVKRGAQQALKGSSCIYLLRWILGGIFIKPYNSLESDGRCEVQKKQKLKTITWVHTNQDPPTVGHSWEKEILSR